MYTELQIYTKTRLFVDGPPKKFLQNHQKQGVFFLFETFISNESISHNSVVDFLCKNVFLNQSDYFVLKSDVQAGAVCLLMNT
jgi:hypothetical protein